MVASPQKRPASDSAGRHTWERVIKLEKRAQLALQIPAKSNWHAARDTKELLRSSRLTPRRLEGLANRGGMCMCCVPCALCHLCRSEHRAWQTYGVCKELGLMQRPWLRAVAPADGSSSGAVTSKTRLAADAASAHPIDSRRSTSSKADSTASAPGVFTTVSSSSGGDGEANNSEDEESSVASCAEGEGRLNEGHRTTGRLASEEGRAVPAAASSLLRFPRIFPGYHFPPQPSAVPTAFFRRPAPQGSKTSNVAETVPPLVVPRSRIQLLQCMIADTAAGLLYPPTVPGGLGVASAAAAAAAAGAQSCNLHTERLETFEGCGGASQETDDPGSGLAKGESGDQNSSSLEDARSAFRFPDGALGRCSLLCHSIVLAALEALSGKGLLLLRGAGVCPFVWSCGFSAQTQCLLAVRRLAAIEIQKAWRGVLARKVLDEEWEAWVVKWVWDKPTAIVEVIGDFSSPPWTKRHLMSYCHIRECFVLSLPRRPGRHELKFIVNGRYVCDGSQTVIADGSGHFNNLIRVRPAAPSQLRLIRQRLAALDQKRLSMERSLSSPAIGMMANHTAPAPLQQPEGVLGSCSAEFPRSVVLRLPEDGLPEGPPLSGEGGPPLSDAARTWNLASVSGRSDRQSSRTASILSNTSSATAPGDGGGRGGSLELKIASQTAGYKLERSERDSPPAFIRPEEHHWASSLHDELHFLVRRDEVLADPGAQQDAAVGAVGCSDAAQDGVGSHSFCSRTSSKKHAEAASDREAPLCVPSAREADGRLGFPTVPAPSAALASAPQKYPPSLPQPPFSAVPLLETQVNGRQRQAEHAGEAVDAAMAASPSGAAFLARRRILDMGVADGGAARGGRGESLSDENAGRASAQRHQQKKQHQGQKRHPQAAKAHQRTGREGPLDENLGSGGGDRCSAANAFVAAESAPFKRGGVAAEADTRRRSAEGSREHLDSKTEGSRKHRGRGGRQRGSDSRVAKDPSGFN
ncbi:uncharacterized protein LOC34622785 [Cyclospora cayetanensis]|uniref:Uncharacterized protein LOC34622785 n=1 Tax=Cyclospora cayetanensis TaxID=88456 RepID=A0A6P6RQQ7_9EIME|nr:uncharacterized protein LOC34622785 [Cyclospora cayetanensis]